MREHYFSLTQRLLLLVLISTIVLWCMSFTIVWFGARHELEEIVNAVPSQSSIAAVIEEEHQELLGHLLWGLLGPFLIGIPVLGLLLMGVILFSLRSTRQLSKELKQRTSNSFQPICSKHLPGEIVPLVKSINALLLRIEQDVEKEKRFTANAAHELRTPLAAIRAQAQVACWTQDPDERTHALGQLQQTADRAAHLLGQLMALARLSFNTEVQSSQQTLEIAPWLRNHIREAMDNDQVQHEWEFIAPPQSVQITTNPALLSIALRNILDNAMRYSQEGGLIQVHLRVHSQEPSQTNFSATDAAATGAVTIIINDSGSGLEKEALARLGERFFRGQNTHGVTGSGLGWSIVYAVAERLNFSVEVQGHGPLQGLSVSLHLQKAASA